MVASGAYFIFKKIMGVVALKRHVKRQPHKEGINASNSIVVTNADNVTIQVPLEIYELFKDGSLDGDLNKMVRPLESGRIEKAVISARAAGGENVEEHITVDERPYFDVVETTVTTTSQTWFLAKLDSHTKTTNSGWLHLVDGTRVFYSYVGQDMTKFLSVYSYNGPVRILCVAHMDENLKVNRVEISDLEMAQEDLFPQGPPPTDGPDDR